MQTVPWIFGIPHPTGFPAFVLAAGAFAHVFALGPVSWRISFFCAMLMLGCAALVYASVVRITGDHWTGVWVAWLLAFGEYFWIYGVRAEIHTMAALCAAFVLCFALRGYYDGSVRAFSAAACAFGLGLATHPIVLFVLPSLALLAAARRRIFTRRAAGLCVLLTLAPLALYAYLPLRSHAIVARGLDPALTLGKPPGGAIWNTENPQTFRGFVRLVTGADFKASRAVLRIGDLPFYAGKLSVFGATIYREFTPVGALAAVLCLALLLRRRAVVGFALLLAMFFPAAFALAYPPVVEIQRYFFIPMIALALSIGLGTTVLDERYRNMFRIPLAAAAVFLLVTNYSGARLRSMNGSQALIAEVRSVTPPDAVIIADWTHGTSLAYASYVDGEMAQRTIDIAWPYQELRYLPRWLAHRPVYYVGGRVIRSHRLLLCSVTAGFPLYAVHLEPGHC